VYGNRGSLVGRVVIEAVYGGCVVIEAVYGGCVVIEAVYSGCLNSNNRISVLLLSKWYLDMDGLTDLPTTTIRISKVRFNIVFLCSFGYFVFHCPVHRYQD
jgi:hypothetical protein